jgi:hypothetical protein
MKVLSTIEEAIRFPIPLGVVHYWLLVMILMIGYVNMIDFQNNFI